MYHIYLKSHLKLTLFKKSISSVQKIIKKHPKYQSIHTPKPIKRRKYSKRSKYKSTQLHRNESNRNTDMTQTQTPKYSQNRKYRNKKLKSFRSYDTYLTLFSVNSY